MTRQFSVFGGGVLIAQLMLGCQASPALNEQTALSDNHKYSNGKIEISEIIKNARKYEGKTITTSGLFYGWSGKCVGTPPKTKSDWMLESNNACIYISGPTPKGTSSLPPAVGIGRKVEIKGTVLIDSKNKPYIEIQ
ncbi:MAG: hypothetical protein B5M52_00970 [Helicobacteraceae bacterium 4484_230]|nr:MAG: hypothetical protein B5M52_00970 [Helicobacteraceae bacterium 4484_230]